MNRNPAPSDNSQAEEPFSIPIELLRQGDSPKRSVLVPGLLLLLTCLTTLVAGFFFHIQFVSVDQIDLSRRLSHAFSHPLDILAGLPFSAGILSILLAHEMGHYLACRYYRLNATLPYVIPAPPPFVPFGTFGAVIRIRSLFRNRRQLFDVGIAGPLAGMVFVLPVLVLGLLNSNQFDTFENLEGAILFGEPLLFQAAVGLFFEGDPALINLHPLGWAAWFGMLATSLNLLPAGQLDGGHIVYSLLGEKAHRVTSYLTFFGLITLGIFSFPMMGYVFFAFILLLLRLRHPRPYMQGLPIDRTRIWVAALALLIFILTFIPVPVRFLESNG